MAKQFTYQVEQDPQALIAKVQKIAAEQGIELTGDHQQGKLAGKGVSADYSLADSTLTITVQKKPLIVPWSMVEQLVGNFVGTDSENSSTIA